MAAGDAGGLTQEQARARDASLAVLARAAIDWATERRDAARVGRLRAELRRLEAAAASPAVGHAGD